MSDVSVIIPTFNRLSLLQEALASVLAQTLPPKEIIIVDDGSSDGTWEWLKTLSSAPVPDNGASLECLDLTLAPGVRGAGVRGRFFRQNRTGPAGARNLGVRMADGRWIAFLDSDDLWLEGKLKIQRDFFSTHPSHKICQTEEIWIRRGRRVNPRRRHRKYSGDIFEYCLPLCIISPSAVMMDRDYFFELGGFDEAFHVCEDYELWLRVSLRGPVVTLPEKLTVKRGGHADQLSRSRWGMDRFRVEALEKILLDPRLTPPQRHRVLDELQNKLKILSLGFAKRYPGEENPYEGKWFQLRRRYGISELSIFSE